MITTEHTHTHTHTTVLLLFWNLSGTTWVSRYQKGKTRKGKTNLDLLEQEIVSGSGICWAICKSAPLHLVPDNHTNIPPLSFLQAGYPSCRPTNSVKALKGIHDYYRILSENTHTHTHTTVLWLYGFCPGQPRWAGTRRNIHPQKTLCTGSWTYWSHPKWLKQQQSHPWHHFRNIC